MRFLKIVIFACLCLLPINSSAEIKLDGYFIAEKSCAAYQSIKKKSNPDDSYLNIDMAYPVKAKNKDEADYYRIIVKDATPQQRWVAKECGKLLVDCPDTSKQIENRTPQPSIAEPTPATDQKDYVLALSLLPAFCQTHQQKTECQTQTEDRYDATHLTLHGLWPQPSSNVYCNVGQKDRDFDKQSQWEWLPEVLLSDDLYQNLHTAMPGVVSSLHKHEWIKHGSCYSETAEEYFSESLMILEQINNSAVQQMLASKNGEVVTAEELKSVFDKSFGAGAGDRLSMKCRDGLITELRINLNGEIDSTSTMTELLEQAKTSKAGCKTGRVDPVGF
mgnify:CR=1 FL=1